MNKTIHIREAVAPEEVERFWQELHAYHARDIFPDPAEEDRAYFLDDSQYRAAVQRIHDREGDRCYYLLFRREGRDIGFADRKSTRLNSSHTRPSRMPSSA